MPANPKVKRPPRPDSEIAKEIQRKLKVNAAVPGRQITVTVKEGFVTVEGTVAWPAQKIAALACAVKIRGVRVLEDRLRLLPTEPTGPISAQ